MIHLPEITPVQVAEAYQAHVHINLLPIAQGQRLGAQLLERWMQAAAKIGANSNNERALHFWRHQGFMDIVVPNTRTVWMGRKLHGPNGN